MKETKKLGTGNEEGMEENERGMEKLNENR